MNASGKMSVGRFEKEFEKEFGVRIEIKKDGQLADDNARLASSRPENFKGPKSSEFEVSGRMHVKNVKAKIKEVFGLDADLYLGNQVAQDDVTLASLKRRAVDTANGNEAESRQKLKDDTIEQEPEKRDTVYAQSKIEVYPNPEYGDSYGTATVEITIESGIMERLKNGERGYDLLLQTVMDILKNNLEATIEYFSIFGELDDLKDENFSWLHLEPCLRVITVQDADFEVDLSPIYDLEGNEKQAAELLNKEVSEIEDWVSDFNVDSRYALDKELFLSIG